MVSSTYRSHQAKLLFLAIDINLQFYECYSGAHLILGSDEDQYVDTENRK